jgi:hypothetical protein
LVLFVASIAGLLVVPRGERGVGGGDVRATLVAASRQTAARRTARVATTSTTRISPPGSKEVVVTSDGTGVTDFASRTTDAHIDSQGMGIDVRTIGGMTYCRFPDATRAQLRVPTPWISFDTTAVGGASSVNTVPASSMDDTIALLEQDSGGLISGATREGAEKVRGVETTRYALTVDIDRVREKVTALAGSSLFAGLVTSNITFRRMEMHVWVDRDGLLRRQNVTQETSVTQGPATVDSSSSQQTEFYDFGLPVSVVAPPPAETTKVNGLASLMSGAAPR